MLTDEKVIAQTYRWIEEFIIGMNICPFARREVVRGTVRIVVVRSQSEQVALQELMNEVAWLDEHSETETTLLVYPGLCSRFDDYLDFVDDAETLMSQQGCEGIYQLATFHPLYCFAGSDPDDAENYTNRSPYPMLHILRESGLSDAIDRFGDTSTIPERNIQLMEKTGVSALQAILLTCMQSGD